MPTQFLSAATAHQEATSPGITLLDLWKIVRRRRVIFFATVVAALGCAVALSIFSTRRYEATGEIQVQKDASDGLGLDSLMGSSAGSPTDALDANLTLQTQAKILESQTLALQVVDQLNLAATPDFQSHFSLFGWISGLFAVKGTSDPANAALADSPNKRDRIFATFRASTKVSPVSGTRLIDVSYTSTDPKLAAATVNGLINSLIDYNFQTRFAATSQTSEWLSKQLNDLRNSSEQLQAKVADLQRDSGVFSFGGQEIDGKGTVYSTVLDQLQQTTVNLTQAQSNRILKTALYEASKGNDPDVIAGLTSSATLSGASPAVGNTLALIQGLRSQEATQQGAISEAAAKFGAAYPKLEEMRANLSSIQQSIRAEQGRLQQQTRSDATVAQQVEDHVRTVFEQQKKSAEALNDKSIQYQLLRQEADQSRTLYESLLSRLKEAGVLEGLRSSNITIVEPGRVASHPTKPNLKLLFAAALFGGIFLGMGFAFGAEMLDSKVHDLQLVMYRFGDTYFGDLPFEGDSMLATRPVPRVGSSSNIFTQVKPNSLYSEALRGLRTAILLARGGSPPRVLLVTSSISQEGKSTLASNLATLLAQQGKRVLLVDADLRRPTLHDLFQLSNSAGLSSLLTDNASMRLGSTVPHSVDNCPGLFVMTAGPVPPYPSELLGSSQMTGLLAVWREQFDFIVMDAAPVLPVTDSVVVAPFADQILLVARHGMTESTDLDRSFRLLRTRVPAIPIGIVINAVKRVSDHNYYGYGYGPDPAQKGLALHA